MSLQIWLPLNKQGDYENKGLCHEAYISSNPYTYNPSGKTGGCLHADRTKHQQINLQGVDVREFMDKYINNSSFSLCAWIKSSFDSAIICLTHGVRLKLETFVLDDNVNYINTSPVTSTCDNKWHFIAGTYDRESNMMSFYVDGELKSSRIYHKTKKYICPFSSLLSIGRDLNNNIDSYYFDGDFSDIRIYDHALSQKEVKEISQGLVVHHKLDIYDNNLFTFRARKYTKDDPFIFTSAGVDAHTTGCQIIALDLVPGKTYTFSCCTDRKITMDHDSTIKNTVSLWFYVYRTNAEVGDYYYDRNTDKAICFTSASTYSYKEEGDNRYSWRYTIPEGYQACCVRVNHYSSRTDTITSKFWDFKLEEGNAFTPYQDVSYDVSGYNVDGTITGDFTMQSSSPRYDKCVKCNGVNNIKLKNPLYNYYDSFTFSFWYKHSSDNKQYNIITSNGSTTFDQGTPHSGWWISCKSEGSSMWVYLGMKYITSNPSIDNNWHHWVVTYTKDNTTNNYKLYLDGVLQNTSISSVSGYESKIPTFSEYLMIGGEKTYGGFYYNQFGNISDFRIYSTALSADDVKDLYETSASIDNRGTLHAREIVENTENIFTLEKLLETINHDNWNPDSTDPQFNPQWVMRNGQRALAICPHPFYYYPNQDSTGLLSQSHLKKYFKPGKQYKFDFWIDVDDNYYTVDGVLKTSYAGVGLRYTDGNEVYGYIVNDLNSPKGFQHKVYYSDPTKTIQGIYFHYNTNTPGYYRSDSSITEMKDVDVQKCGIVEAPWLVDTKTIIGIRSQYDTNIYEEPDGSRWVRIFHHANPSSSNLFSSTDSFSTRIYGNSDRWFDVSICNQLSSWELMIKQKPSSTDTIQKYRWKQYVNPMLATESDVSTDKVIYDTSTGYTSSTYGGLFKLNEYTYLTQGDYFWGAVGCWSVYDSGIPGWNRRTISSTGYMDLYVRIDDTFQKETNIYDNKIECNSFIEN